MQWRLGQLCFRSNPGQSATAFIKPVSRKEINASDVTVIGFVSGQYNREKRGLTCLACHSSTGEFNFYSVCNREVNI